MAWKATNNKFDPFLILLINLVHSPYYPVRTLPLLSCTYNLAEPFFCKYLISFASSRTTLINMPNNYPKEEKEKFSRSISIDLSIGRWYYLSVEEISYLCIYMVTIQVRSYKSYICETYLLLSKRNVLIIKIYNKHWRTLYRIENF